MFNWLNRRKRKQPLPDPAVMERLLRMVARTQSHEISCDEVYTVLDQFAEAARRGEDLEAFMPLVRQHLDMCPDCREEYEAILRMLEPIAGNRLSGAADKLH
jgi:hypothetical protein